MTSIEVSAQFGGGDAAAALLPHFDALKAAAQGISFEGFPFPKLSFILRVDGQARTFGQSGPGRIDIDPNSEYISIDIGIPKADWSEPGSQIATFIAAAIAASTQLLKELADARLDGVEWLKLEAGVGAFADAYRASE